LYILEETKSLLVDGTKLEQAMEKWLNLSMFGEE
jgi:hypothetical protein